MPILGILLQGYEFYVTPSSTAAEKRITNIGHTGTVRQLFFKRIKQAFLSPQFQTDVVKPLKLDDFIDQVTIHLFVSSLLFLSLTSFQEVKNLSGYGSS
jgi:hypothetical protein